MKREDIINAYLEIKSSNINISDDVLDFMRLASIDRIDEDRFNPEEAKLDAKRRKLLMKSFRL